MAGKSARKKTLRIASWNVNGLRACARKGFAQWLERSDCDVVALQEVRAFPEQLEPEIRAPEGWHTYFAPAQRPGYSGVAFFSRHKPDSVSVGLGDPQFDLEGRLITLRLGPLILTNGYFPKGSGPNRDNSRVPYKLDFYRAVFDVLGAAAKKHKVLVMGDFNTAHQEIDLARPKGNPKTSGFLPEEREEFSRWIDAGWVDTFRQKEPAGGHYTWWSQRLGARARNVGWRIDYVLASQSAQPFVRDAFIWPEVTGSDHCPCGVDIDRAVLD